MFELCGLNLQWREAEIESRIPVVHFVQPVTQHGVGDGVVDIKGDATAGSGGLGEAEGFVRGCGALLIRIVHL